MESGIIGGGKGTVVEIKPDGVVIVRVGTGLMRFDNEGRSLDGEGTEWGSWYIKPEHLIGKWW